MPLPDPSDRPAWSDGIANPYLHGIHAPTDREATADELPVEGEIPRDLCGAYVRVRAHLRRWRMNLATGEAREEPLDDLNVEFPLPDTEFYGSRTRFSYHQHLPQDAYTVEFRALVKYDHDDGSCVRYDYPNGWFASESPFARRMGGSGEDDGYVVTLAVHAGSFESQCWIFSARDVDRGPLARVRLPARVPTGFHAKWIPGDKLWPNT